MSEGTTVEIPYRVHPLDRIHQGDIIRDLGVLVEVRDSQDPQGVGGDVVTHPYAVVLSQECDLEQDDRLRSDPATKTRPDKKLWELMLAPGRLLASVAKRTWLDSALSRLTATLLAPAWDARAARDVRYDDSPWLPSKEWDKIAQNKNERYHVLEAWSPRHNGLLIDFKQVFTVSTEYLYAVLRDRPVTFVAAMAVPYREHLSDRFAHYLSRVALPRDHEDPSPGSAKSLKEPASATQAALPRGPTSKYRHALQDALQRAFAVRVGVG